MKLHPMHDAHACTAPAEARPWLWQLPPQQVRRLAAAPHARWLAVECGRVWLTATRRDLNGADDLWLSAGERQLLPAGTEWVAEGWPEARWTLLEPPQDGTRHNAGPARGAVP